VEASIIAVCDTGILLNGEPVPDIHLSIEGPDPQPLRTRTEVPVPPEVVCNPIVGAQVTLRFIVHDPADPSRVVIDWGSYTGP
jgi:hypothetical protein